MESNSKINYTPEEIKVKDYLDECGIWSEKQENGWWELENYTPAGGDMCWQLEELTEDYLQEFIDSFDINEEVLLWWRSGSSNAPFANIKQHYEDVEDWLDNLQQVCDDMPN